MLQQNGVWEWYFSYSRKAGRTMNMTTEWFSSARLGERYCRIKTDGRPDVYVFPKNMSNTYALCAVHYGSVDRSYCLEDGEPIVLPDGIAHFLEHKMFTQPDGTDAFDRFSALKCIFAVSLRWILSALGSLLVPARSQPYHLLPYTRRCRQHFQLLRFYIVRVYILLAIF